MRPTPTHWIYIQFLKQSNVRRTNRKVLLRQKKLRERERGEREIDQSRPKMAADPLDLQASIRSIFALNK